MATATLRPASEVTFTNPPWAAQPTGVPNTYQNIDDDPDSPNETDRISATGTGTSAQAFFGLTDVPADFSAMTAATLRLYYEVTGWVDDNLSIDWRVTSAGAVFLNQLFIVQNANVTKAAYDKVGTLSASGLAGTLAEWNAAQLEFTYTKSNVMGGDTINVIIYAVELNITYTAIASKAPPPPSPIRWRLPLLVR